MLIFLLICADINLFSQQDDNNYTEKENAAVYYLKAMDLLKHSDNLKIGQKIDRIIEKGWSLKDNEFEKLIIDNELCFDQIEKAILFEKCNFDLGKTYKYMIDKKPLPFSKIMELQRLLTLNARYNEAKGYLSKTTHYYLTSLTFAYHISQDNSVFSKLISNIIEIRTYKLLKDYIKLITKDTELLKIANYLNNNRTRHFPAIEVVEIGKKFFISSVQVLADNIMEEIKKKHKDKPKKIDKIQVFIVEFIKLGNLICNEYYDPFLKAAATNDETDWKNALDKLEKLEKLAYPGVVDTFINVNSLLFDTLLGNTREFNKKMARTVLMPVLAASMFCLENIIKKYYMVSNELDDLLLLIQDKIK